MKRRNVCVPDAGIDAEDVAQGVDSGLVVGGRNYVHNALRLLSVLLVEFFFIQ